MTLLHKMVLQDGFEPETFQRRDIDRHDIQHPLRIATSYQRIVGDSLLLPMLALRCLSMLMTRWLFLHAKLLTRRSRCDSSGSSLGSLLLSTSGIVSNFMFGIKASFRRFLAAMTSGRFVYCSQWLIALPFSFRRYLSCACLSIPVFVVFSYPKYF